MTVRNAVKLSDTCTLFDDMNCTHMVLFPQRVLNWTLLGMQLMDDHCVDIVVKHSSLGRTSSITSGNLHVPALIQPRHLLNNFKHIVDSSWPIMTKEIFDLFDRTENSATFFLRDASFVGSGQLDFNRCLHTWDVITQRHTIS